MSNLWKVRDIIERIQQEQQPVGLYLSWAESYAMAPPAEALNILRRLNPDHQLRTNYTGGSMFIGYHD